VVSLRPSIQSGAPSFSLVHQEHPPVNRTGRPENQTSLGPRQKTHPRRSGQEPLPQAADCRPAYRRTTSFGRIWWSRVFTCPLRCGWSARPHSGPAGHQVVFLLLKQAPGLDRLVFQPDQVRLACWRLRGRRRALRLPTTA